MSARGKQRRRAGWWWLGGVGLGALVGCLRIGTFACERDSQCELDGREGICVVPGYCALPDDGCESGYRFHERGLPDDLAGHCAPPGHGGMSEGSSTSDDGSTSSSTSSSSEGSSSSAPESSSEGDATTTGTDCGDHPCPCTVSLAAGANFTCITRDDGRVICWGANNQGQLGMGTTSGPIPWPQLVGISGEVLAQRVHAGNEHTCARGSDGALHCWGRNLSREIAPGAGSPDVVGPTVLPIRGEIGAVGLSPQHSCVGDPASPGLQCLGNNGYGELGGNGGQPIHSALPGMNPADDLALGQDHSCARAGGRVWCWGRDNYGQLGQNMVPGPVSEPVEVSLPSDAVILVAGRHHNCVAIDGGNVVRCWGHNDVGEVGDGTTTNRQLPNNLAMQLPGTVVAMDAMLDTTCALLDDGELWCWGGTYGSQLGTGIAFGDPMLEPRRVNVIDELPEPIVEFGLGGSHLCARASSGRLWCWGRDNQEQLGPIDPPVGKKAVEIDVECPVAR